MTRVQDRSIEERLDHLERTVHVDVRYDIKLEDGTLLDCHAEEVQEIE